MEASLNSSARTRALPVVSYTEIIVVSSRLASERFESVSLPHRRTVKFIRRACFGSGQCYPDFPDNFITVTRALAWSSFTRALRFSDEQGTSITSRVGEGGGRERGCVLGEYHLVLNSRLYDSSRATPIAPKRETFFVLSSKNGNIFSTQIRKAASFLDNNKFASIFLRIGKTANSLARQVAEAKISPISHPSLSLVSMELPFFHRGRERINLISREE